MNNQNRIKISIIITFCLAIISSISYLIERIALKDLWENVDTNLVKEWEIITYLFIPHILFYASVFAALTYVLINLKKNKHSN